MFQDRSEAGARLAEKLREFRGKDAVVLAIPRGGVPVGYVVAKTLDLPLDLVLTKKIGHPFNKEYAIGAVSLTDSFIEHHPDVSPEYIEEEIKRVQDRLKQMSVKFKGEQQHEILKDKILIVVDDGIATGNTLMATIRILRKQTPKSIIVAVPVAPEDSIRKIEKLADEVVVLLVPETFYGVGEFYANFQQVSDEEVSSLLKKYHNEHKCS